MQIIPAIDIRGGKTVRLLHGDYDQQTAYDVAPVALAERYASLGLSTLHVVDLDGALDGQPKNLELLRDIISSTHAAVQIGGGLRETRHLAALFEADVCRAVIGSLAVTEPDTVIGWLRDFGANRIMLAVDVRIGEDGAANVATHGWTRTHALTVQQLIEQFLPHGLQHILCTDIGRDGALSGPSIDLYRALVERYPALSIQASGGVSRLADLYDLRETGVSGAIIGRALLEGRITDEELRSF